MRKFAVISGFLGSGKTTTMMALTRENQEIAMISNDLGGKGLADHKFAELDHCNASEITDECICFQTENLVEHLNRLFEEGCKLVMSDIPGFGVGALEHVYHTLNKKYPELMELAPFTVLVEPETLRRMKEQPDEDVFVILKNQILEADLIVLNKCDLLSEQAKAEAEQTLRRWNPQADFRAVSALTGEGMEGLLQALKEGRASLRHPAIDYEDPEFDRAFGNLCEYYIQYYAVVCCDDFDGNAYLTDLAETVRQGLLKAGADVPHLKLLAWEPEGDFGKADLIGVARPLEINRRFSKPCTEIAVTINGTLLCAADKTDTIIGEAVASVGAQYQLENTIFRKQCFGMGE